MTLQLSSTCQYKILIRLACNEHLPRLRGGGGGSSPALVVIELIVGTLIVTAATNPLESKNKRQKRKDLLLGKRAED